MRKFFAILLGVTALSTFASCGGNGDNNSNGGSGLPPVRYEVTFRQPGYEDVVKSVFGGYRFSDFPAVQPKTGYTVAWEVTDIPSVNADMVVNAVETPNEYTITYDPNGGTLETLTQTVTYDAEYTLAEPTRDGYDFVCWAHEMTGVTSNGTWKIANDVTFVAQWAEIKPEECTVTFVQNGYENVVKTVEKGQTLTDIPTPQAKTGYTVTWNVTSFENIQSSFTVNAVETPNQYTVSYVVDGALIEETTTVTYGAAFTLYTPTYVGYTHDGWTKGGESFILDSVWTTAENVTLTAKKKAKTFTVKLDAQGGTVSNNLVQVTYGQVPQFPTPTRTDHAFKGWTYNGKIVDLTKAWSIDAEEITLKASWENDDDKNWTDNY